MINLQNINFASPTVEALLSVIQKKYDIEKFDKENILDFKSLSFKNINFKYPNSEPLASEQDAFQLFLQPDVSLTIDDSIQA